MTNNLKLLCAAFLAISFATSCKKIGNFPGHGKPPVFVDSLKRGLLLYFPFSGNTEDGSGNNLNGASHNVAATADRFGKANSAYYFNGVDSYVIVPDVPALRLNNTDFTLNAWVKLDSYNSPNILSKRLTGANNGWQWSITNDHSADPGGLLSYGPGGGSINAFGTKVVDTGSWHMVTSTYVLATKTFSLYIDGVLDTAKVGVLTPNPSITSSLYIGKDDPSIPTSVAGFKGTIDDVRIYIRALSNAEIGKLYKRAY